MNTKTTFFLATLLVSFSILAKDACPEGTLAFVCTNAAGKVKLNRCATGNACYDKDGDKESLRCCPVKETTGVAKKALLSVTKDASDAVLNQFKQTCNYSSPIDFVGDNETHDSIKKAVDDASLSLVRALIFAEANCTDEEGREQIKRWLGNDVLMKKPIRLIYALSHEDADPKMYKVSGVEKDEWYGTECQDQVCSSERQTYHNKKKTILEATKGKVPENLEPIRNGLIKSVK